MSTKWCVQPILSMLWFVAVVWEKQQKKISYKTKRQKELKLRPSVKVVNSLKHAINLLYLVKCLVLPESDTE